MLIVISPAKKLDYVSEHPDCGFSQPAMLDQSQQLVNILKHYSPQKIAQLMHLSDKLASLNAVRYDEWALPFTEVNARQAVLAFRGDVYAGMNAYTFNELDFSFAQKHLRILSGLYGLLRPLDLVQPYRLEMGTKLENPIGKNLYAFWGDSITEKLNEAFSKQTVKTPVLLNLASTEYFKSVNKKMLGATIITPIFKDEKANDFKVIGIYAKRARGLMVNYIVKNRLKNVEEVKAFDREGYCFNAAMSNDREWVFIRSEVDRQNK